MSLTLQNCNICPRNCGANRLLHSGFCGAGAQPKVARAALHFYEEPCISGTNGSGTVFFSGCPLHCVFCQNPTVSQGNYGKEISVEHLGEIFLELQAKGAHNINLVSPTQYTMQIANALELVKPQLHIPVVYNTGGYDNVEALQLLNGKIDIYLADFKYSSNTLSKQVSGITDYFGVALNAITEMVRQTKKCIFDDDGMMQRGVIVRHLVLPDHTADSLDIFETLAEHFTPNQILLSVMSQYTPDFYKGDLDFLQHRLEQWEYTRVVDFVSELNFDGFIQDLCSADEKYTPTFDLEGV